MITLWGFRFSVYVRIVRMALAERGLTYDTVETSPFDLDQHNPHPFGRVPMFQHGTLKLYETAAITTYISAAFEGETWEPADPAALAQVEQVISIIDNYAYWPMVRQVYSNAVFQPAMGEEIDRASLETGLKKSGPVLDELEKIAAQGRVLGKEMTRADLHLAPMLAYFSRAAEGEQMLATRPNLARWFSRIQRRESFMETEPGLPNKPGPV